MHYRDFGIQKFGSQTHCNDFTGENFSLSAMNAKPIGVTSGKSADVRGIGFYEQWFRLLGSHQDREWTDDNGSQFAQATGALNTDRMGAERAIGSDSQLQNERFIAAGLKPDAFDSFPIE
jgi:hypothetical protein